SVAGVHLPVEARHGGNATQLALVGLAFETGFWAFGTGVQGACLVFPSIGGPTLAGAAINLPSIFAAPMNFAPPNPSVCQAYKILPSRLDVKIEYSPPAPGCIPIPLACAVLTSE